MAALPLVPAFAILICVPLALRAVGPGDSTGRLLIVAYPLARGLLAVSSAAAVVAMTLATLYAVGNPLGISAVGLEDMVRWHGSFNALGYVLCGLLGWNLRRA